MLAVVEGDQVVFRRSRQQIDDEPWSLFSRTTRCTFARDTVLEKAATQDKNSSQVLAELYHERETMPRQQPHLTGTVHATTCGFPLALPAVSGPTAGTPR
jgi:hypothetical protein